MRSNEVTVTTDPQRLDVVVRESEEKEKAEDRESNRDQVEGDFASAFFH